MSRTIVLDSGVLGLLVHPKGSDRNRACLTWLRSLLIARETIAVPQIADYEVRRELRRLGNQRSLDILNQFRSELVFWPMTAAAIDRAAELWAKTRQEGYPTAGDKALDGDVILVAQTILAVPDGSAVVATTNIRHLGRFLPADLWEHL